MNGLFAMTIWLLGCAIWIASAVLIRNKRILAYWSIASAIIGFIGILLLFQRGHLVLGGSLLCLTLFLITCTIGFEITWQKGTKNNGQFVGKQGITVTILNPRGKIKIDNDIIFATTEGLFLAEGEPIKVIRSSNKLVVVEKIC